jgi:hypothetical protein
MSNWKAFVVLACGAVVAALAPASASGYLPPHGEGGKGGGKAGGKGGGDVIAKGKKIDIAFTGAVMTMGGKKFTLPVDEDDLIAVLGKPDRTADLANKIITWDEIGVFAYIRPKTTTCHAFAICIGNDTLSFWPKKSYSGKLTVDGAELKANSDIDDVNDLKKGKPFKEDNILTDVWSIDHKEGTLYLRKSPKAKEGFIKLELGISSD